jgi:hypothetical protein
LRAGTAEQLACGRGHLTDYRDGTSHPNAHQFSPKPKPKPESKSKPNANSNSNSNSKPKS